MKLDTLRIIGFKGTPRELLDRLMEENQERFKRHFTRVILHLETLDVPEEAYDTNRQQYKAKLFLESLEREVLHSAHAIGLVDLDLFVPDLNFIFGSAQFSANAIVALPRLRQSFYGLPNDEDLFFHRVVKEVFHELGHVLQLRHCNNRCVMRFSNSLNDTDEKPDTYCSDCMKRLPA